MTLLRRISAAIDRVNDRIGSAIQWLTLVMVVIGAFNAIARYTDQYTGMSLSSNAYLVLCSQSLFRFADLGDDGLCRGGPDKGCGVIVSAIDVVVDRLD